MAGRRERQKQLRERRILRGAEWLFTRRGYDATRMEEIATRAELSVGAIYNYFPSKADVLLAILRKDTGEALTAGEAIVERPPKDPADAVAALLEVYLTFLAAHDRRLWREMLAAALASPAEFTAAAFEADLRLIAQLRMLLDGFQSRDLISAEIDPARGATTLYAVYLSWFLAFVALDAIDLSTLKAQLRGGIDTVMNGLRRKG